MYMKKEGEFCLSEKTHRKNKASNVKWFILDALFYNILFNKHKLVKIMIKNR